MTKKPNDKINLRDLEIRQKLDEIVEASNGMLNMSAVVRTALEIGLKEIGNKNLLNKTHAQAGPQNKKFKLAITGNEKEKFNSRLLNRLLEDTEEIKSRLVALEKKVNNKNLNSGKAIITQAFTSDKSGSKEPQKDKIGAA